MCQTFPIQSLIHLKQEREFLPLTPDADDSAFVRPDSSAKAQSPNKSHCPSHQTAGNYVVLQYTEVESIFLVLKSTTKYTSHLENSAAFTSVSASCCSGLVCSTFDRGLVCVTLTCLFLGQVLSHETSESLPLHLFGFVMT